MLSTFGYEQCEFKSIPKKLIVKCVKSKEETPKSKEIVNGYTQQYPPKDRPNSKYGGVTYP